MLHEALAETHDGAICQMSFSRLTVVGFSRGLPGPLRLVGDARAVAT